MNSRSIIPLALSVALASVVGTSATAATTDAASTPPAETAAHQLSPPAGGVVKMLDSGVPEDVINAYIQNAPTSFNLTPDDIIRLQQLGVSSTLTTAMLNHDKALRDSAAATRSPSAAMAPDASANPSANDSAVYSNLAPYGYWNDSPQYGAYWQPYSWLAYDYYPWTWLGFGYWWNFPGRGWCWFPHSHFRGFHNFHNFHNFAGNHIGSAFNRTGANFHNFAGNRIGSAFNRGSTFQTRTRTFNSLAAPSSGRMTTVRSSPWASSFNGGFHGRIGGGFQGGSSSFRAGGGGGFRSGGGGGFHGGGHR